MPCLNLKNGFTGVIIKSFQPRWFNALPANFLLLPNPHLKER